MNAQAADTIPAYVVRILKAQEPSYIGPVMNVMQMLEV